MMTQDFFVSIGEFGLTLALFMVPFCILVLQLGPKVSWLFIPCVMLSTNLMACAPCCLG